MYDLYECNNDDTARFILGRNGTKKLFVVGLNPSTANKEKSDTTIAKVERVARNNGFDGFVMANLYPLRSTDPNGLPEVVDENLFQNNFNQIMLLAEQEDKPIFWAAWGGDIVLRAYLSKSFSELVTLIAKINGSWVNYGELRKDGHPRHPSRLSYSWQFSAFDAVSYAQRFS